MAKKKGKAPEALPDESLDQAAGGLNFTKQELPESGEASFPGFAGGIYVASGDVNAGSPQVLMGDGSVRPVKPGI